MDFVFIRKSLYQVIFMSVDPLQQVTCETYVKCPITLTR